MAVSPAIRALDRKRDLERARQARVRELERSWVAGSELTPAQLAEIQPNLKAAFLEREGRKA